MASSYPTGLDLWPTNHVDRNEEPILAGDINNLADAINKIEAELGISPSDGTLPSSIYSTLVARLNALDNPTFNNQTVNYTLVLADFAKVVSMNSSASLTLTIPPHSSVAFPIGASITVRQAGTGGVLFAAGTGVSLHARGGAGQIAGQYGYATLIQTALDVWDLIGDIQ